MQKHGFVMLEVITAVVILSTLMVVTTQVWQSMARNRNQQAWINDTEIIRQATLNYWITNSQPPTRLDEVLTTTQLETLAVPWQQSWSYVANDNWLELTLTAPSTTAAAWFAGKVAGAFSVAEKLVVPIWRPAIDTGMERLLHRVEVTDKPHLNRMEADLNMSNQVIENVASLTAVTIAAETVQAGTIQANQIRADEIDVQLLYADDVSTPSGSLSNLAYWVNEYERLWLECEKQGKCF